MEAARSASSARVIDYSSDPDHNRMVLTLLGKPDDIRRSILASSERAVQLIDMRRHEGAHPRIGAVDVIPLVPIRDITMQDCVALSSAIANDLVERLSLPVYFYERSAVLSHRTNLADIRRGGFEHLSNNGLNGDRAPDLGPRTAHPTAGAVVVGARGPLVAYNVNLKAADLEPARAIVRMIRNGEACLDGLKSLAVWLESRSLAQVSMNVTRPDIVPLRSVYEFVETQARKLGVEVANSEIIGAISAVHLDGTTPAAIKAMGFQDSQLIENWLDTL